MSKLTIAITNETLVSKIMPFYITKRTAARFPRKPIYETHVKSEFKTRLEIKMAEHRT